jgi:GT2 family glycosyltransferase
MGVPDGRGCSVIVATRNRPALLRECLTVLLPTLRPGDELLVVDSASDSDETRRVAEANGVRTMRVLRKGLSLARNAGVAATSRPIMVFTDDDCRPRAGWLDALEGAFDAAEVGFVVGRVRADVDDANLPFESSERPAQRWVGLHDPIDLGVGACMAFRREAWSSAGGVDERLGAGTRLRVAEEHDLFYRLLRAGWSGRYEPEALVLHRDWRTRWDVVRYMWGVGLGTGAFVAKVARTGGLREASPLLRRRLWTDGLVAIRRDLARRWEVPALADTLKLLGTVVGLTVGAVLPLDGELFRVRSSAATAQ